MTVGSNLRPRGLPLDALLDRGEGERCPGGFGGDVDGELEIVAVSRLEWGLGGEHHLADAFRKRFAMAGFERLEDIQPHPDVEAGGEERQWGRRLAKRFSIGASRYAAKAFTVEGDGSFPPCLDFKPLDSATIDPKVAEMFAHLDVDNGDSLITYGWAMEEELRGYTKPD